jgi:ubiquinol-cytochrome c reductase cytochrome c subunit
MKKSFIIASAFVSAALVAGAAAAPAPGGDAVKGKAAVLKYGCYTCHGYEGQGAGATGKKLAPNPLPYAAFSAFVRNTDRDMPPFTDKVLPEQDLRDIHAYFSSIQAAPNPANIQVLKDIGG